MKTIHPAIAEHVMEENEKLRGLLREAIHCCPDEQLRNEMKAALPQQAEPADELPGMWESSDLSGGETDCIASRKGRAAEGDLLAIAEEAGGVRIARNAVQVTREDLERIVQFARQTKPVEPAPAQDEREAFEVWVKTFNNAPERLLRDECDRYLDDWIQCRWLGWQAALATRPAQTAPQPERWHAACGDWRETSLAIHGERSGYIACGIPEDKAHAIIKAHNTGLPEECAATPIPAMSAKEA